MGNNGTNLRLQRHEHKVETLDQLKKKALHIFEREVLSYLIGFSSRLLVQVSGNDFKINASSRDCSFVIEADGKLHMEQRSSDSEAFLPNISNFINKSQCGLLL